MSLPSVNYLVEERLDQLFPYYDALVDLGYFSLDEVKKMAQKRRKLEYDIRSQEKRKEDYLKYINWELNLDLLKTKRALIAREKIDHSMLTDTGEIHSAETNSQRIWRAHLNSIFKRALNLWPKDADLWQLFIKFSTTVSPKISTKVFSSAIKANPTNADFWIMAAHWEIKHHKNVETARVILQRSLRFLPKNERLWLEYFKLEMWFTNQIRSKVIEMMSDKEKYRNIENDLPQVEEEENVESKDIDSLPVPDNLKEFFKGSVPLVVFANAAKNLTGYKWRFRFLDVIAEYPNSDTIQNQILRQTVEQFMNNPKCISMCISYRWQKAMQKKYAEGITFVDTEWTKYMIPIQRSTLKSYREFSKFFKSGVFWEEYVQCCLDMLHYNPENTSNTDYLTSYLINTVFAAIPKKQLTEKLCFQYINTLIFVGKTENEALPKLKKFLKFYPRSVELWLLYMRVVSRMKAAELRNEDESRDAVLGVVENAINATESIDKNRKEQLWFGILEYVSRLKDENQIEQFFKRGVTSCPESVEIKEKFIKWGFVGGLETARRVYKYIMSMPFTSLDIYRRAIDLEMDVDSDVETIRELFWSAIRRFGEDNEDIWLEFIQFEQNRGEMQEAGTLYWKATKTLKDVEKFNKKYHLMK